MKVTTVTLFLAAIHAALAHPSKFKRQDDPNGYPNYAEISSLSFSDPEEMCGLDISTPYARRVAWYASAAGYQADARISTYGYENWYDNLLNEIFDNSPPSETGCDALGVDGCDMPASCEEFAAKGYGEYYWLWYAITSMQTALSSVSELLQTQTILDLLNIDTLVEDFGGEPESSVWGALSAGFGIASSVTSLAPGGEGSSAALGALSAGAGFIGGLTEPDGPEVAIQEQISNWFASGYTGLERTLYNVLGKPGGVMGEIPATGKTEHALYPTEVGQWFAEGKWLANDVQDVIGGPDSTAPFWETATSKAKQGIISRILKSQGVVIWISPGRDEAACTQCEGLLCPPAWSIWMGGDQCFELRGAPVDNINDHWSAPYGLPEFEQDKYDKMIEYGIDITEFYQVSYDCMKAVPDGSGDVDGFNVAFNGNIPQCFFNIPVHRGDFNSGDGTFNDEPLW